tara:strand:- start:76 stop:183 length:108 start_codon:yes stop_codon:yes gene_type:complete
MSRAQRMFDRALWHLWKTNPYDFRLVLMINWGLEE